MPIYDKPMIYYPLSVFILECADFIGNDTAALVLGDNIFYSAGLSEKLQAATQKILGRRSLGTNSMTQNVLVSWNLTTRIRLYQLLKSRNTQSQTMFYVVTGLYFYGNDAVEIVANVKSSA